MGPAGIGLMGIYQNIMGMASTIASCGMAQSGVRQLATSVDDESTLMVVRRALLLANLVLGLFGLLVLWLFREAVAQMVFGEVVHVTEVGWLGVGVFLSLLAGSQTALLQGLRRIGDLARVNVFSAFIGSLAGIACVYYFGEAGVIWFVILSPFSTVLVAVLYTARLPRSHANYDLQSIQKQWQAMLKFGIPLMAGVLLTLGGQLIARSMVLQEIGIEASGYFQAAWTISMTYIGFVLGAMAADYFPRLTQAINDHQRARQLVNEQAEMALLLAGPVLLAMITLAPWVIILLYAEAFSPAVEVLRWQMLGNILKVVSWPMGFILLASGRGWIFVITQFVWNSVYLLSLWYGLEEMGLLIVGVGFFMAYVVSVIVVRLIANKLIGFTSLKVNVWMAAALLATGGITIYLATMGGLISLAFGMTATLLATVYSLRRLNDLLDWSGWFHNKLRGL